MFRVCRFKLRAPSQAVSENAEPRANSPVPTHGPELTLGPIPPSPPTTTFKSCSTINQSPACFELTVKWMDFSARLKALRQLKGLREGGNTGKLSHLPAMPLDVLYTLPPTECPYGGEFVNRARPHTLGKRRARYNGFDYCSGIQTARYVHLFCGAKSVRRVEFILMIRICFACVKANGISKDQLREAYPDEHKLILDLVQPTRGSQRSSYYNRQQIERVLERIRKCANKEELKAYVQERKAYLERLLAHADLCYEWLAEESERKAEDVRLMKEERFAAIKSRLRKKGFVDRDMDGIRGHVDVAKDRPLTERIWTQIGPRLTGIVFDLRVKRLLTDMRNPLDPADDPLVTGAPSGETQRPAFVVSRCNLITQHYLSYKRSLSPTAWRSSLLPSVEAVWCLPSMRRIIALREKIQVTPEMVQKKRSLRSISNNPTGAEDTFAFQLESVMDRLKGGFSMDNEWKDLKQDKEEAFSHWMDPEVEIVVPRSHNQREDLATVQGKCLVCQRVFSSAFTSIRHSTGPCFLKSDTDVPRIFKFSRDYLRRTVLIFCSRSAAGLVWATLGAERMYDGKVGEMDERGKWYRCLKCTNGSFIGTWRECIVHAFQENTTSSPSKHKDIQDQGRDNPVFQILLQEEVRGMNLKDERECWSCAHCTVNAERLWTREVVAEHLRNEHRILKLRVPRDFFYAASDEA
ncbi:hypothetical protein PM082_022056 [Marasmius tenuissimus]|nr:hypothetical protein PM082_022056 [Marasmius tenuissimus]